MCLKKTDGKRHHPLLVVCVGTLQLITNDVFAHMPVGYALALFQLSIVVSVWFGHRLFNEKNIRKKLLGAAILLAGTAAIILLK